MATRDSILSILLIAALLLALPGAAQAAPLGDMVTLSIGDARDGSSLAVGGRFGDWGLEAGAIPGDGRYPDALDYPCPHDDYRVVDDDYVPGTYGFDTLRYFDLQPQLAVYLGAGLYFAEHQTMVQSRATGWIYENASTTETDPAFSGGIVYRNDQVGIGLGYHSLRGANLQFLVNF
ncbi:hypothetical protein EDC14_100746 [Hydrogenispora ethanolica]|jgi:hypothetical protein|uniref:Outer membrane protein with beta-barrel domain n=1 Tax=Hydrogenispora ethanolica TaxID=1082276 RepID=A0A4R1RYJ5_HYDET|nr:hypothetical protein [Hydrogenispora ethanolica]TCL71584.1 hypothetical protein EDC14_100746 [Hydrogenispora ethanolica]